MNIILKKIVNWLKINKLKLNNDKTKCMIITTSPTKRVSFLEALGENGIFIANEKIEIVDVSKYLGIIIDSHLKFDKHITFISKKIGKKIGCMARMASFLSPQIKLTLYKSLISPHFDYCSSIFWNMNKQNFEILQKLQNKCMRVILMCNRRTHINDMLKATQLLSVKQRVMYNTYLLIFKMKNNLVPSYLCSKIIYNSDVHNYNTRKKNDLFYGSHKTEMKNKSIFQSGFSMFNKLPDPIKSDTNIVSFKKNLIEEILKLEI